MKNSYIRQYQYVYILLYAAQYASIVLNMFVFSVW